MEQQMHDRERVQSGANIVQDNSSTIRNAFKLTHWRRLKNVKNTEKYKAQEKGFPSEWNGDKGY